jgi:hypothetical protein
MARLFEEHCHILTEKSWFLSVRARDETTVVTPDKV